MDIKLKRYSISLKTLAFLLITAATFYAMLTFSNSIQTINDFSSFGGRRATHYTQTWQFIRISENLQNSVETIMYLRSEENILAGNALEAWQSEYNEYDIEEWSRSDDSISADIPIPEDVRSNLIQQQLRNFREAVRAFENNRNITYYISAEEETMYTDSFQNITSAEHSWQRTVYDEGGTEIGRAAFAFNDSYIDYMNIEFMDARGRFFDFLTRMAVGGLAFLAGLAYLIFAAGKKATNPKGVHHPPVDKIYNEFTAILFGLSVAAVIVCGVLLVGHSNDTLLLQTLPALAVLLSTAFLLALVRHIKSKTLLKHTFIFTKCRFVFIAIKKVYDSGPIMIKAVLLVAILAILTAIPFMFLITLPLAIVFTYKQVNKYLSIKNGINDVKLGNYSQKIELQGSGELNVLADDINDISLGLSEEVERRIKSERLKTELIVNVSHDIKTPLTSVITYIDLLKKANIKNADAKNYIEVISGKADRLKILIDDLFDASKAASGNVTVNLEQVDLTSLITQGLGELDDKIKASSLNFRVNTPSEKVMVYADGKLLWRVLENLLSNVFKYSLENSRVYIDIEETADEAYVEIKNISGTELNIPEDEIMERFKRGDESRNSEGSGLGLDIAKSLMRCQNGELTIKIDGDLFKTRLKIAKK